MRWGFALSLALAGCTTFSSEPPSGTADAGPDADTEATRGTIACGSVTCIHATDICCFDTCAVERSQCAPLGTDCSTSNSCDRNLGCDDASDCIADRVCCGALDGAGTFEHESSCIPLAQCAGANALVLCAPSTTTPCASGTTCKAAPASAGPPGLYACQ